jgi:nitrile hydratase beta subunit
VNGVHDMGGMQGYGPMRPEKNEPVFHARWESRVYAMYRALGAWGRWNIDASRHSREVIPPAEYLRMSYYEKWLTALTEMVISRGFVTRAEIQARKPAKGSTKATPPLTADKVAMVEARGANARRNVPAVPQFVAGQSVRARNMHPLGHTRLPWYARGKQGIIDRDHGVFVFPDTNSRFLGEKPQHVYSVRFTARELWGDEASPRDSVYIDLWEHYLERA